MYCSKCGLAIREGQKFCGRCGRATPPSLDSSQSAGAVRFEQRLRRLRRFWLMFAGLNLALGGFGLILATHGLNGPWEPWPHPPAWGWALTGELAWTLLIMRIVISCIAGWELGQHAERARVLTFLAAAVAVFEFPIGVVLAIYTCIVLVGKENAAQFRGWSHAA